MGDPACVHEVWKHVYLWETQHAFLRAKSTYIHGDDHVYPWADHYVCVLRTCIHGSDHVYPWAIQHAFIRAGTTCIPGDDHVYS